MLESVEPLGAGLRALRSVDVPRYAELVEHVIHSTGAERAALRGYRCRVAYPVYGSEVMLTFEAAVRSDK